MTLHWRAVPLLAALATAPAAAQAHAILIDSRPAAGATMEAGPADLLLRFNSRIDALRSRLILTRPDHTQIVLPIAPAPPDSTGNVLAAHGDFPPGAYTLRWQVLAVDGHITRGDVPFTVQGR